MMRTIELTPTAKSDYHAISSWLADRTVVGVDHWIAAFRKAADEVAKDAERYPLAPEARSSQARTRVFIQDRTRQAVSIRFSHRTRRCSHPSHSSSWRTSASSS